MVVAVRLTISNGYIASKQRVGDGISTVEDCRVTRCLGARSKAFQLLVHGLEFRIVKRTSQAILLCHKDKSNL
jgi:hypothetical protein